MMTNGWQVHKIGDLLVQNSNNVKVAPDKSYKLLGVRLEGRGAFLREEKTGDSISANTLSPVHAGDFIYSRLFAWRGAFDVVSEELDGCFVSGEFPTFKINTEKLLPKFLQHYFDRKLIWEEVEKYCTGTTKASRNRFKEQFFLGMNISIPPLTEQRRIITYIESLAARVNKVQRLREEASEEADKYFASVTNKMFTELAEKHTPISIGKTFTFRQDLIRPTDGKSGKIRFIGLQHIESNTGRRIGEDTLYAEQLTGRKFCFSPGEIVYGYLRPYLNKVWIADCEGVCSVDQYVIRPNENIIDTNYLAHFMRSPVFLQKAIELTHNLLLPRLRTGLLESILIPVPPLDEQRRIDAYLDGVQAKVNALRELQSASGEELSALLPSVLDRAFKGEL